MDFRGVTGLFANDDFWAVPEADEEFAPQKPGKDYDKSPESEGSCKTYVNDVPVNVLMEQTQLVGPDGRLITESLVDYSRRNILGEYARLDDFLRAWNRQPLTRSERARKVRSGSLLDKYEGLAREVLSALLDKYAQFGIGELCDTSVLAIEPFLSMGGSLKIAKAFGGKQKLLEAMDELQAQLYAA